MITSYISSERMVFMARKKKAQNIKKDTDIYIASLIGGGIGLAASLLMILISPLILIKTATPNAFAQIAACLSLFLGGCTGGFMSAVRCRNMPMGSGLLSSLVTVVPTLLVSFFIPGGADILGAVIIIAISAGGAALGAFIFLKSSGNKKKKMKRALKRR